MRRTNVSLCQFQFQVQHFILDDNKKNKSIKAVETLADIVLFTFFAGCVSVLQFNPRPQRVTAHNINDKRYNDNTYKRTKKAFMR